MDIATLIPIGLILFAFSALLYSWREIRDLRHEAKALIKENTTNNERVMELEKENKTLISKYEALIADNVKLVSENQTLAEKIHLLEYEQAIANGRIARPDIPPEKPLNL